MAIKYYYIDDDPLATIEETAKGLSIHPNRLQVFPFQHRKWEEIVEFIIRNQDNFEGLLLDWGLNRENTSGEKADFNVEALTQQIRRLSVENDKLKKDFPIILCSAQFNFSKIYNKLLSSHDLFDAIYEKDFFHENHQFVENEMIGLADAYRFISKSLEHPDPIIAIKKLLNVHDIGKIDYRFLDYLLQFLTEKKPIHEIVRFILTKLINPAGPLIGRELLSSRLGVQLLNVRNESVDKLLSELDAYLYKGVFSQYKERWWMELILEWWDTNFEIPLGSLSGEERAQFLNNKLGISLQPLSKTNPTDSTYFWTVCKSTHNPISISDGILASMPLDKSVWEDDEYFSIGASLEQDASKIHPLERERVEMLKKLHTKVRRK